MKYYVLKFLCLIIFICLFKSEDEIESRANHNLPTSTNSSSDLNNTNKTVEKLGELDNDTEGTELINSANSSSSLDNINAEEMFNSEEEEKLLKLLLENYLSNSSLVEDSHQELINQAEKVDAHDSLNTDIIQNEHDHHNAHMSQDNSDYVREDKLDSSSHSASLSDFEQQISDFEAAEIVTFEIGENEKEMIFDPLLEISSHVKLAFVVSDENAKLDFQIINPNQDTIFSANSKSHLFHQFNATLRGEYIFSLDNRGNQVSTKVTFAIHQGNSTNSNLSHDQLKTTWEKIESINRGAKKARFTARLLSKKYDAHFENSKSHNKKIVFFSIVETGIMTLIFFFQLCYIKSLANKINL